MGYHHLGSMILDACDRGGESVAMRYKRDGVWREISYGQLGLQIQLLAHALRDLGIGAGDRVAIFSPNRPEWSIADFAAQVIRAISVPVYATSTSEQLRYILADSGARLLLVGGREPSSVAAAALREMADPPAVVCFDVPAPEDPERARHLDELLAAAGGPTPREELDAALRTASSDDVATVIYTSGTTGEPKGVLLSHANFAHQAAVVEAAFTVGPEDRSLCFLPLSHVYERSWSYYVFAVGAENSYLDDPKQVIEAMQEVRPTVMVSVPRLYEKVYGGVRERMEHAPAFRRSLFRWAMRVGFEASSRRFGGRRLGVSLAARHALANRLVLSKIRSIVGGPKNFFSAGGAPLAREIEEFFLSAGLLICQGYGLTETSPMVSCNTPGEFRFGTVGRPVPGCEVRIGEAGEVQVRGPNVMRGYHNKPEATADAFVDGWFRTGDVGDLDADGYLRITDRIKDLIITSGGKNIAPQSIEMSIGTDHFVEQVAVVGDRRPFLVALVVPSFPALEGWAREQGLAWEDRPQLVTMPEVRELYRRRIDALSGHLARFERVQRFTLLAEGFGQASGEITPTLKLRRRRIEERHAAVIDAMYAS